MVLKDIMRLLVGHTLVLGSRDNYQHLVISNVKKRRGKGKRFDLVLKDLESGEVFCRRDTISIVDKSVPLPKTPVGHWTDTCR